MYYSNCNNWKYEVIVKQNYIILNNPSGNPAGSVGGTKFTDRIKYQNMYSVFHVYHPSLIIVFSIYYLSNKMPVRKRTPRLQGSKGDNENTVFFYVYMYLSKIIYEYCMLYVVANTEMLTKMEKGIII